MTTGVFRAVDSGRAIVVLHRIRSCVQSEDERDNEREAREEEHEERGFTQAGCCNTGDHAFVSDARIREQHPQVRLEEHTSELQSQSNLVCRLLLEKKKNKQNMA